MPRTKTVAAVRERTASELFPPALMAAGRRLPANPDYTKVTRTGRDWQDRCWEFYDIVGEYRYACDWVGNIVSKATLFLTRDGERVDDASGNDYVYSLFGGPESQGQMLREIGIHLTVAGELYVVGLSHKGAESWRVIAATELTTRGGKYYASSKEITSDGDPLVIRVWRPHPRKYNEANSPSRAVLNILAELNALTKRIFAEIDSRLAGAGVLFIPSEMTMPTSAQANTPEDVGAPQMSLADAFRADLQDAMLTAIGDREDASAMVPVVATAPGEHIGQVKHLTFWSDLDQHSIELRTEAIRRLALGLDMPPEILTGVADVNHWSAWASEEAAIKAHAEPLLALICDSLTEGYLRPLLIDDGMDPVEAQNYAVAADTSLLRLRPNRSKEAFELYDRMQLDGQALRRETGFAEDDAPDDVELRQMFIRKVASGSTTPDLVAAALRALGVPIPTVATAEPAQARPTPSLEDHPTQDPPEAPPSRPPGDDGLLGASEVMVHRALERAGNRLKSRIGSNLPGAVGRVVPAGTPASEMHLHVPVVPAMLDDLLADAFTGLDRYACCKAVDSNALAARLDSYCRSLLVSRSLPDHQMLATMISTTPRGEYLQVGA